MFRKTFKSWSYSLTVIAALATAFAPTVQCYGSVAQNACKKAWGTNPPNTNPSTVSGQPCACTTNQYEYDVAYECLYAWLFPETCIEQATSLGTCYSPAQLSPTRTWISWAGCVAACPGLGATCIACVVAAIGGTPFTLGGSNALNGLCGVTCAGAVIACFNGAADCCGYYCVPLGVGSPNPATGMRCTPN